MLRIDILDVESAYTSPFRRAAVTVRSRASADASTLVVTSKSTGSIPFAADNPRVEITHLLRAGVTRPHLDRTAGATWLAMVHDSIRALGGVVATSVEEPTVGRNHYRVGVRLRDDMPLRILFNAAAFLVAGAEQQDSLMLDAVFVDVPGGVVYRRAGLRVATAAELNQPLDDRHLRRLTAEERRDVAYHQPSRLGDLLFNWFD
ncbi:hypothetical protein ACIA5A_19445 [Micromonospora sp. NPDC051300]|uniref:hypothetical protein n=1 Tax=Micromonospora sp. NPDC051300 TaxID=3364286 RepID=UPI0037AE0E1F